MRIAALFFGSVLLLPALISLVYIAFDVAPAEGVGFASTDMSVIVLWVLSCAIGYRGLQIIRRALRPPQQDKRSDPPPGRSGRDD
jgi:hypothetical protein